MKEENGLAYLLEIMNPFLLKLLLTLKTKKGLRLNSFIKSSKIVQALQLTEKVQHQLSFFVEVKVCCEANQAPSRDGPKNLVPCGK